MDVVERARRYLAKLPPAVSGSGGHDATFKAACVLVDGFALDDSQAMELLSEWNVTHCTPMWSELALRHKIQSVEVRGAGGGYLLEGQGSMPVRKEFFPSPRVAEPKWPALDIQALEEVMRSGLSVADLFDASPVTGSSAAGPYNYLSRLFAPGSLVCVGKDTRHAEIAPVEALEGMEKLGKLSEYQFVVPSPMKAQQGQNLEGRRSVRCLDNTARRRYLVVECDFEQTDKRGRLKPEAVLLEKGVTADDLCAAVLLHLAEYAPLVMAVSSGGKSTHGWFAVMDQTEDELMEFMRYAVSLGADKATWTRCQYVRLPAGQRDNGCKQQVMYFHPSLTKIDE
jgi:hypothetical protein